MSAVELNNRQYYVGRATAARALAEQATDEKIAAIHAEMAAQYDQLAEQASVPPPVLKIVN